ncbi:hypothetical protein Hdeb2414_s0001g00034041 [Helianthus debilis subsp. tardiflorus]
MMISPEKHVVGETRRRRSTFVIQVRPDLSHRISGRTAGHRPDRRSDARTV